MANPISSSTSARPSRPAPTTLALFVIAFALFVVGFGLFANVLLMLLKPGSKYPDEFSFDQKAYAQAGPGGGGGGIINTRGISIYPAQLGPTTYGLYLLDLDSSTIVVYRAVPEGNRFKLMAARSWKNDRFLEDFNNDTPTPKEVKRLVDLQRERMELTAPDRVPETRPETQPESRPEEN